jgi:proteic killer suppression protein
MLTACVINASRYHIGVLRSFKDRDTEAIWHRQRSRRIDGPTQRVAWRKLGILDAAETLADLRVPPGNRLEKLRGDRAGQYSIRISSGGSASRGPMPGRKMLRSSIITRRNR